MRTLVAIGLFMLAAGFVVAAVRGPAGGRRIAGSGIGVAAILAGFAVLFNAVGSLSSIVIGSGGQRAEVDGSENTVVVIGRDGSVTIGETADERFRAAVGQITPNYVDELGRRLSEVEAVEAFEPSLFWDGQRPNESQAAYEERARAEFDRYIGDIEQATRLYPVDTAIFRAREVDLGFDAGTASALSAGYQHLGLAHDAFTDDVGLVSGLRSLARQASLSDEQRIERAHWLWTDKNLTARISLLQSVAAAVDVGDVRDHGGLEVQLTRMRVETGGVDGPRSAVLTEAARLSALRAEHLANDPRVAPEPDDGPQPIGDEPVTAQASFEEAAMSFLAADGREAAAHLQRARDTGELSDDLDAFAAASIDRLENLDRYRDALGIFVLRLDDGRLLDSGLEPFDTIIAVDGEPADDVTELVAALVRPDLRLTVLRGQETIEVTLSGSGPGGAVVSTLVVLQSVQI